MFSEDAINCLRATKTHIHTIIEVTKPFLIAKSNKHKVLRYLSTSMHFEVFCRVINISGFHVVHHVPRVISNVFNIIPSNWISSLSENSWIYIVGIGCITPCARCVTQAKQTCHGIGWVTRQL